MVYANSLLYTECVKKILEFSLTTFCGHAMRLNSELRNNPEVWSLVVEQKTFCKSSQEWLLLLDI